jgi:TrmH family RNA methyltransferase
MISSPHNPKVKLTRALSGRAKERREAGAFLAEGIRLIEEALAAGWPIRFALYTDELSDRGVQLVRRIQEKGIETDEVERATLATLSETEHSQGVLAVLDDSRLPIPRSPKLILIPDSIRDPGNLGTLLRAAGAAGVQAVLIPPETTDVFAPKVVRAGMGAHFRLPIHVVDWNQIRRFAESQNLIVYLADMAGQSCWETNFRLPLALIVGGEAEGATEAAHKLAKQLVGIPMPGNAESLNAAIAGAVLLFEIVRQMRAGHPSPPA